MKWLALAALLSGCSHRTRLDCIDTCKERGLQYEGVVETTNGYDTMEHETQTGQACRCGYGKVPE